MNHHHIIIIPIRWYPEFFHFALRSWEDCRGIERYSFRFIIGKEPELPIVEMIVNAKLPDKELVLCQSGSIEPDLGEAQKQAVLDSPDWFLECQGDERVSADFLEVAEQVAAKFASSELLSYSARGIKYVPLDPGLLIRSHGYHSQGCLIFSQVFHNYVAHYLTEEYYRSEQSNPWDGSTCWCMDYFHKNFPERNMTWIPKGNDGLLDTICRKHNLFTLTSIVPRVQEIGFAGGRKGPNRIRFENIHSRSLTERIAFVGKAIAEDKLPQLFGEYSQDFYEDWQPDHEPVQLRVVDITDAGLNTRADLEEQKEPKKGGLYA